MKFKLVENLTEAELINYNANMRGKRTGDCVKRSLSLAFNMSYSDVEKELNQISKKLSSTLSKELKYDNPPVFTAFVLNHGAKLKKGDGESVEEFADNHPNGTYVLGCGKTEENGSHLVAVIDGKIYDSWDSRDRKVVAVITVTEENSNRNFQGTSIKDSMPIIQDYIKELLNSTFSQMTAKENLTDLPIDKIQFTPQSDYGIIAKVIIVSVWCFDKEVMDYHPEKDIPFIFTPETTVDQAKELIKQSITKSTGIGYKKLKELIKEHKQNLEHVELEQNDCYVPHYMNSYEKKLYNSLSLEMKKHLTYLRVENLNAEYSDAVEIKFKPYNWDNKSNGKVLVYYYDIPTVLKIVSRYENEHEVPWIDYDPFNEYG